jgi:hypothetical protein
MNPVARIIGSTVVAAVMFGGAVFPFTHQSHAQGPLITGGLINVTLSNVNVGLNVPIGIAANLCDVNANVLAAQRHNGDATCNATATNMSDLTQNLPPGFAPGG